MRTSDLCVALVLALLACNPDDTGDTGDTDSGDTDSGDTFDPADTDHDGFTPAEGDCDDANAAIHPDAEEEWYDGVDQDCLRDSDWDQDGDGHVPPDNVHGGVPYIGILPKDDCDDTKAEVNPDGTETCATAYDDDCDGVANPTTTADAPTWYLDSEGDGYGVTSTATKSCTAPDDEWVTVGGDCDDDSAAAHPGATTVPCDGFDNDCSPTTFETSVVRIGGTTYADLAAAVTAAAPSDTITLCEGKHAVSNLRIQKALTIDGLGDARWVVIDAANNTALWIDTTDPVVLRDVTVTRGHGRFSEGSYRGGAAYVVDAGSLALHDCEIVDNSADQGAGIYVGAGGSLSVTGGRIAQNTGVSATVPFGGGIWLGDAATLDLEDTVIEMNTSGGGGGIHGDGNNTITGTGDVQVRLNEAELTGAGIRLDDGATVSGLTVVDNYTDNSGGGILLAGSGTFTLTDLVVDGNYAGLVGGGIDGSGTMNLTDVTISANHGGITGGGLHLVGDTLTATLTDCAVVDNFTSFFADVSGGAYVSDATLISVGTDWGTDAGGDDNHPGDVWLQQSDELWDYGDDASFTCNDSVTGTCVAN